VSSLDYVSGVLKVVADYTEDMEDRECNLVVSYSQNTTIFQYSALQFIAKGRNWKLLVSQSTSTKKTLTFFFKVLSYAALGVFLLSLLHKMIGAEFIVSCQVIYFSFAYYEQPTFISSTIRSLQLVTGYRNMFYT
jgi:hypothetical protein